MPAVLDSPSTESFAVIRMDPVASVRHLNDPEALRAAEALSPRSYLVYLDEYNPLPIGIPQPWHGFDISPIAPSLRPPNNDECATPAMCTPIFPSSSHPEGRAPLRTQPTFPFDNCYLWSGVRMKIRVCPRPEGFKWDAATQLPMGVRSEHFRWTTYEREDAGRQRRARQARESQLDPIPEQVPRAPPVDPEPADPAPRPQASASAPSPYIHNGASTVYSDSEYAYLSSTVSTDMSGISYVDPALVRLFADPVESPELHPLCHLWTEVEDNIKQDAIPSPELLFEERDAIVRIIREARARDPTIPPLPVPRYVPSEAPPAPPEQPGLPQQSVPETKSRRFRPAKLLRKVGLHIRTLLRVPYILVWP